MRERSNGSGRRRLGLAVGGLAREAQLGGGPTGRPVGRDWPREACCRSSPFLTLFPLTEKHREKKKKRGVRKELSHEGNISGLTKM